MRPRHIWILVLTALSVGLILGAQGGYMEGKQEGKAEEQKRWFDAAAGEPFLRDTNKGFYYIHKWRGGPIPAWVEHKEEK